GAAQHLPIARDVPSRGLLRERIELDREVAVQELIRYGVRRSEFGEDRGQQERLCSGLRVDELRRLSASGCGVTGVTGPLEELIQSRLSRGRRGGVL